MDTLTKTDSPRELYRWMNDNLIYNGVNKGKVYTPEESVKIKKVHCWESSELAYHDLKIMGYDCTLIYLETPNTTVTHITLIYEDKITNKFYWFEWAWYPRRGIHGPYKSFDEVTKTIIDAFAKQYKDIGIIKYGKTLISPNINENDYINKILSSWKTISYRPVPLSKHW